MLHRIDTTGYSKPKRWCGPGALSALTGLPLVTTTEMLVRAHGGDYQELERVWPEDVILALHELGYTARSTDIPGRFTDVETGITLTRWWRSRTLEERAFPTLVEVHGHFITTHYDYACDNQTMRPVPIGDFPKPNRRVRNVWVVTPL